MTPPSLLIATDFSTEAGYATRRAAAIAREAPWSVHLLHVLPASLPPALHVAAAGRAQEALAAVAEALGRNGVPVSPQLGSGDVAAELAKAAAAHELIVLGARGQDVLRDFATGRTALRVVRESRQPVLLVKHAPEGPYRRVVAAVDFSEPSFHAAGRGVALAPRAQFDLLNAFEVEFESSLRLAGVASDHVERYRHEAREKAMAALEAFAGQLGVSRGRVWPIATHGYPARVICDHAARIGAELIVIGKHCAGLVERTLIGSVALQVLENAPCDVLVVPEGAA